jgi:hypothetical protein
LRCLVNKLFVLFVMGKNSLEIPSENHSFTFFFLLFSLCRLGSLNVSANQIPTNLRRKLEQLIEEIFSLSSSSNSKQSLPSALDYGMMMTASLKLGLPFLQSDRQKEQFFSAMNRIFGKKEFSESSQNSNLIGEQERELQSLSFLMGHLHFFFPEWEELPKSVQNGFFRGLYQKIHSYNAVELSSLICGLVNSFIFSYS